MSSDSWEKGPLLFHGMSKPVHANIGPIVILICWLFLYFHSFASLFDGVVQLLYSWDLSLVIRTSEAVRSSSNAQGSSLLYF